MVVGAKSDRLLKIFIHTFFIIFCTLCFIPLMLVISISFTDETYMLQNGYSLIPQVFSLESYKTIIKSPTAILNAYKVTIMVTAIGTFLALLLQASFAYTLSRRDYAYGKALSFFVFFSMLFKGGLVPFYLLVTKVLGLQNTMWALIIPTLGHAWNIIILRTFFKKISPSFIESAKIDGASEFRIFFGIIIPLSKPALATIGLFITLGYWNDWFMCLLFINDSSLYTIQFLLQNMLKDMEFVLAAMQHTMQDMDVKLPTEGVRMAMMLLGVGPMLFIFPFFQKYFVKGLTVGGVKE